MSYLSKPGSWKRSIYGIRLSRQGSWSRILKSIGRERIYSGPLLALAPFVLSHLYRSIHDRVTKTLSRPSGPLWILEFCLYEYIKDLGPPRLSLSKPSCYGDRWITVSSQKSFQSWLSFFHSLSLDIPLDLLCPFKDRLYGPHWYRDFSVPSTNPFLLF